MSRVKQGCNLAPRFFCVLFFLMLQYAFSLSEEDMYKHIRSNGSLFKLALLRAKTKVRKVHIREMLFADDAALTSYTEAGLQELINPFACASKKVWSHDQYRKDPRPQPKRQFSSLHFHWWLHTWRGGALHLPWLNHFRKSQPGDCAELLNRQGYSSYGPPIKEGVGKHQAHHHH